MPVHLPVAAQFLIHRRRQRNHPVLITFTSADDQFMITSEDIVNGQGEAFAQTQSATVDELERRAVTSESDLTEEQTDLLPGQYGRQTMVIPGVDLREDLPVMLELFEIKDAGGGDTLANGSGLPLFFQSDMEQILPEMSFRERGGIALEVFMDQPHAAVVRMTGSIGVELEREQLRIPGHRFVGMLVFDGIDKVPATDGKGLTLTGGLFRACFRKWLMLGFFRVLVRTRFSFFHRRELSPEIRESL